MYQFSVKLIILCLGFCLTLANAVAGSTEHPPGWVDFDQIEIPADASEVTEIDLNPFILGLAELDDDSALEKMISIRVKTFSVDSSDFDELKGRLLEIENELPKDSWTHIVRVSRPDEFVNISFCSQESIAQGLLIMTVDTDEVTLINMVGEINLSDLEGLELDAAAMDSLREAFQEEDIEKEEE